VHIGKRFSVRNRIFLSNNAALIIHFIRIKNVQYMPVLKAFLLVAGRGERLRPLTETTPKCLLPIRGTPLLQIWLEHLERFRVDEVLINTHWLHEQVHHFVKCWSAGHERMKITLFHEPALLGSAGTLLANRQWVEADPFFIIYGDNLTRLNLQKMLDFHNKNQQPLTIRIYGDPDPRRAGIVCLDANDIVIDFEEKPQKPKSNLGAGGIYIAERRIFDFFPVPEQRPSKGVFDLSCHVLPLLAGNMKAYNSGEFSLDIGCRATYEKAQKIWAEKVASDI
jgi:mannose-1-phosphate guanylyltransferase